MSEYFIAYTPDDIIWGIGPSTKEALNDAIMHINGHREMNKKYSYKKNDLKVIDCTEELYGFVCDVGGALKDMDKQYYWAVGDDGIAGLTNESVSEETLDKYRELLSVLIDNIVQDHPITNQDWGRACLLAGRYCEPFLHNPTTKNDR